MPLRPTSVEIVVGFFLGAGLPPVASWPTSLRVHKYVHSGSQSGSSAASDTLLSLFSVILDMVWQFLCQSVQTSIGPTESEKVGRASGGIGCPDRAERRGGRRRRG